MNAFSAFIAAQAAAFTPDRAVGVLITFLLAVIAIGIDLQTAIRERLGRLANTSAAQVCLGRAAPVLWGMVVAIVYLAVLAFPEWASHTFGFDVQKNELVMAGIVGVSAVLIIRSKFTKLGNLEIGFEAAYLWSRAKVLNSVNKMQAYQRETCINTYHDIVRDTANYPRYFTQLRDRMLLLLRGRPDIEAAVREQIGQLERLNATVPADRDADAREFLTGVFIDYFGARDFDGWARGALHIAPPVAQLPLRPWWRCAKTRE